MNTIETDRLILRDWKYDDYLDFHEFVSDKSHKVEFIVIFM